MLEGEIIQGILINPLGMVMALLLIVLPAWLAYDLFLSKRTLLKWYRKTEELVTKPYVSIPLIALVIVNWVWNIAKGL